MLKPLKDRVAQLEKKIEVLEAAQKQITDQLSDAAVYADAQRRSQLLSDFEKHKAELAKLTAEWEAQSLALEEKEAELAG